MFVGRSVDRLGPKPALLAGAALICVAMAAFAHVSAVWHVYPAFLLLGTGFACIHTVTLGKIIARWFYRQRARAMAAATLGAGVGGAVLAPLNAWLLESHGVAVACAALAAVTLAVLLPAAIWAIKDGPESMGLEIDGGSAGGDATAAETEAAERDAAEWTLKRAMGGFAFWALAAALGFGMLAQSAFLFHQTPFLHQTLGLVGAAGLVSATTLAGLAGRFAFLLIGDRLSTLLWLLIVFCIQAASFVALAYAETATGLFVGCVMFGATMGLVITLQPLAVAHVYGRTSFGRIYGAIYFAIRAGAAIGPVVVGGVLAFAGGYPAAWLLVAASLAVAMALCPLALRRSGDGA